MTGEFLALAAMVMFATNILVTKAASNRLDVGAGFVISVAVNLLFALLVFAVALALRSDPFRWDLAGVLLFMLAGACATYLGRWFFFGAIARLGPAKASLFHVSSPAFTVIVAWLFLGEALPLSTLLAIVATIVGLFLVSTPPGLLRARTASRGSGRAGCQRGPALESVAGVRLRGRNGRHARVLGRQRVARRIGAAMERARCGRDAGAVAALALHLVIGSGHRRFVRELLAADRPACGSTRSVAC